MNTPNKSICNYAWNSACMNPLGIVEPCGYWTHQNGKFTQKNSGVGFDPRDSAEWVHIRTEMLDGRPVSGCEQCYEREKLTGISGRIYSLENDPLPTNTKSKPLEMLEVAFSNLCNLACVGCGQGRSTKWSTENIKAGRPGMKLIDNHFDWTTWDLSKLKRLKILGGEPFMESARFCELLEQLNLPELMLTVNTNGTILPGKRLRSLIEQCKSVDFCVSLDGWKTANDWSRWPGKFDDVTDTMKVFNSWWGKLPNINLSAYCVVNMFNIFTIEELMKYMKTEFANWKLNFVWSSFPEWQLIQTLPQEIKDTLIQNFSNKTVEDLNTRWRGERDFFKVSINYLKLSSETSWESAKQQTVALSKERNIDLEAMIPEFKKIIDDF